MEEEGSALRRGVNDMLRVEREIFAFVVDGAHLGRVDVAVVGWVWGEGGGGPRRFP